MATAAYKIVALDETRSGSSRQGAIPQVFSSMIIKAFVNSMYAFMDGLVYLASAEAPLAVATPPGTAKIAVEVNLRQVIDLRDYVSQIFGTETSC